MSGDFESAFQNKAEQINGFIKEYWQNKRHDRGPGIANLLESIKYSANEGGKRFRPVLAILTAEALGKAADIVIPYAASVEFIHTYSLIHDDLPCMDNDDMRRGRPTNHKVFGESVALLAGDALLTEAFCLIANAYETLPGKAAALTKILSEAAGVRGMVGGQAIDMLSKREGITLSQLENMHRLKTGALIASAVTGAAVLCDASLEQVENLKNYGELLGLAFQIADDILDFVPEKIEPGSYPALLGIEKTRSHLSDVTNRALACLSGFNAEGLRWIAKYNLERKK